MTFIYNRLTEYAFWLRTRPLFNSHFWSPRRMLSSPRIRCPYSTCDKYIDTSTLYSVDTYLLDLPLYLSGPGWLLKSLIWKITGARLSVSHLPVGPGHHNNHNKNPKPYGWAVQSLSLSPCCCLLLFIDDTEGGGWQPGGVGAAGSVPHVVVYCCL